jgi:hypothetical protein
MKKNGIDRRAEKKCKIVVGENVEDKSSNGKRKGQINQS